MIFNLFFDLIKSVSKESSLKSIFFSGFRFFLIGLAATIVWNTDNFVITWKGKTTLAPSDSSVYLQIYNRDTTSWETIDTESSANANTEFTLSGVKTTSLSDYYDESYVVDCRVYQEAT